jgi:hypothetical protein
MGMYPNKIPVMPLTNLNLTPTRTIYEFEQSGLKLILTFMTPLLPHDLRIVSRPVTYVSWEIRVLDGKEHDVEIYFDNSAELVVNSSEQEVTWSRFQDPEMDILCMGSKEQPILQKSGDNLRIDWGYLYLVSPRNQGARSVITGRSKARDAFLLSGSLPPSDDLNSPRRANDDWPVMSYALKPGKMAPGPPIEMYLAMAYDDVFSIEYFHRKLQAYWKTDGTRSVDLLRSAIKEYDDIKAQCRHFDDELMTDMKRMGGEEYAKIAALAYRQAIAAHKLVSDIDGTPLLFPKENFSNGCISTVDVIYPTAPIFMLFNIELLKASVTPILEYSMMKRWSFPFAPHDLGTYPLANGQVYGGGENSGENQMPVEECGNMLILVYGICQIEGSAEYALRFWLSLEKWAGYLREKGLDPENQLCTDDFAGHLAHNVNLSLKAILALGAYSRLCDLAGKQGESKKYWDLARDFAGKWLKMADDGDHYRLAFDKPGTWSQKYNLVWDRLLGLDLFPPHVAQKEIAYYRTKQNKFGLPLDNRKDYTKLDWTVWTATLAQDRKTFEDMISRVFQFLEETPNRVPLTDWYDTKTAKQVGFQARSVVGGVFIKMLSDREIWKKWSSRVKK